MQEKSRGLQASRFQSKPTRRRKRWNLGIVLRRINDLVYNVVDNLIRLITRRENGLREADYATLIKFADYFNVSIDYLLERTETPNMYK